MPNRFIYVLENGLIDRSRWLSVSLRLDGAVALYLSDLCLPGHVSSLTEVRIDVGPLMDCLRKGAVQIVASGGYLVADRAGDVIQLEFRGKSDSETTTVEVGADDFLLQVSSLSI